MLLRHISIISFVVAPVSPNSAASGLANNSKIIVNINVTIKVSIIPYFIASSILDLFFIP